MKILENLKNFFFPKPEKTITKIDIKGIEKKTKAELEKLGRTIGVELDRRLTKAKLISEIKKQNKKL